MKIILKKSDPSNIKVADNKEKLEMLTKFLITMELITIDPNDDVFIPVKNLKLMSFDKVTKRVETEFERGNGYVSVQYGIIDKNSKDFYIELSLVSNKDFLDAVKADYIFFIPIDMIESFPFAIKNINFKSEETDLKAFELLDSYLKKIISVFHRDSIFQKNSLNNIANNFLHKKEFHVYSKKMNSLVKRICKPSTYSMKRFCNYDHNQLFGILNDLNQNKYNDFDTRNFWFILKGEYKS